MAPSVKDGTVLRPNTDTTRTGIRTVLRSNTDTTRMACAKNERLASEPFAFGATLMPQSVYIVLKWRNGVSVWLGGGVGGWVRCCFPTKELEL